MKKYIIFIVCLLSVLYISAQNLEKQQISTEKGLRASLQRSVEYNVESITNYCGFSLLHVEIEDNVISVSSVYSTNEVLKSQAHKLGDRLNKDYFVSLSDGEYFIPLIYRYNDADDDEQPEHYPEYEKRYRDLVVSLAKICDLRLLEEVYTIKLLGANREPFIMIPSQKKDTLPTKLEIEFKN